jgi:hypothetical protein
VNDREYAFIQLFQCPSINFMEHLIELPTHERSFLLLGWHFIALGFAKGLIIM